MQTIVAIQALRAVAALAVAAVHFNQVGVWLAGGGDAPLALYSLASGVDLFFVISGFVMVYSSEGLYGRPDAPWQFMARRLARIVAPYWLATVVAIPLMQLPFTWDQFVKSLLFIPYPIASGAVVPLFGVGWTLNFEMFFYALFALALFGPRWSVVPAVCTVLVAMVAAGEFGLSGPAWWQFLSDPIVLEFAMGMMVAVAYRRKVALPFWLRAALIVAGASAIWLSQEHMPPSHWRALLWGLPALMILAGAVLGPPPAPSRLTRLAIVLGDASYAMYLLHGLVSAALMRGWSLLHWIPLPAALVLTYLGAIVLSIAAHRLLERPATVALKRMLGGLVLARRKAVGLP
jgi:exopolysaccharide production protein ExoZ